MSLNYRSYYLSNLFMALKPTNLYCWPMPFIFESYVFPIDLFHHIQSKTNLNNRYLYFMEKVGDSHSSGNSGTNFWEKVVFSLLHYQLIMVPCVVILFLFCYLWINYPYQYLVCQPILYESFSIQSRNFIDWKQNQDTLF